MAPVALSGGGPAGRAIAQQSSSLLGVMQKGGYYQYQCFMRAVQLLQDLIHDGVGQVGDHGQLHLPGEEQRRGSVCWAGLNEAGAEPVLLQSSVDVLGSSLHEGVTDAGARDGHLLGDGRERRVEPLGRRAGHRTQLAAQRHHRVHDHLRTRGADVSSRLPSFCCRIPAKAGPPGPENDIRFKSRRTCSSLSAALASSPARVSSRCLTGPSTDSTWASSHREGYSWHARKNRAEMSNSCTLTGQRDPGPGGGLTALESRASLRICLAVRTSSSSSQLFRVHTCCCTRTHRRSITWTRGKRR